MRQEEKGTIESEMVGWHHQLDGHGFGWTPGVGDGQGNLYFCEVIKRGGRASMVPQMVKNLPATRETWVQSLGREDPLEKEMATHSSILAWKISWIEDPGGI